jgi:hypothetical protein
MDRPALSGDMKKLAPNVDDLRIMETTKSTLNIQAVVNVTNPTNYSISIPYVSIHLIANDTVLGYMIAENMHIVPGWNNGTIGLAKWDPIGLSGEKGHKVGNELLSQFMSGISCLSIPRSTFNTDMHQAIIPPSASVPTAVLSLPTPNSGKLYHP